MSEQPIERPKLVKPKKKNKNFNKALKMISKVPLTNCLTSNEIFDKEKSL